jgi:hypothetical protein
MVRYFFLKTLATELGQSRILPELGQNLMALVKHDGQFDRTAQFPVPRREQLAVVCQWYHFVLVAVKIKWGHLPLRQGGKAIDRIVLAELFLTD